MKKKIAILVISCDKYSDLWEVCTKNFNKFWPDSKYDKFLMSNQIVFNKNGFNSILVGNDYSWSAGVRNALIQLSDNYEYVFTLLEDYLFVENIDNHYMESMFNSFVEADGNFLRLLKVLNPQIDYFNEYFGYTENYTPYRQTVVFTLWNISTLLSILKDDENAWEFEKVGVKRGYEFDKFFCVYKNNFKVINLVIKGKVVPKSYKILKRIFPDFETNRIFFTRWEILKMTVRDFFIISFLKYVPAGIRSKIYFLVNK